ncbi:MAG: hypothetical protein AAFP90_04670, partial [Planctomycetota bacterium]
PPLSNTALFAGQSVTLFARGAIDSIDDWTLSASNHSGDRQRFSLGRRPAEDAAFDNTKPDSSAANPNSDAPETNRMASATCLPLRAMWGRQRVRMLEDRYVVQAMESDESEREAMREQIVNTSLTSGVLCRYTAFVAVDQIVRHAPGQSPHSVTQAIEVPEGWQWQVTPRIPPGSRVSMSAFVRGRGVPMDIPLSIVELLPESLAREIHGLPIAVDNGEVIMAVVDETDLDLMEKLRSTLNRQVRMLRYDHASIQQAINHHYGQIEGETADSMLREFTETAIDFTTIDFEDTMDDSMQSGLPAVGVGSNLAGAPAPRMMQSMSRMSVSEMNEASVEYGGGGDDTDLAEGTVTTRLERGKYRKMSPRRRARDTPRPAASQTNNRQVPKGQAAVGDQNVSIPETKTTRLLLRLISQAIESSATAIRILLVNKQFVIQHRIDAQWQDHDVISKQHFDKLRFAILMMGRQDIACPQEQFAIPFTHGETRENLKVTLEDHPKKPAITIEFNRS